MAYLATVDIKECLYIETWARSPDEIVAHLQTLEKAVTDCNARYIAKIQTSLRDRDGEIGTLAKETGPQGQLNRIIAGLDFSPDIRLAERPQQLPYRHIESLRQPLDMIQSYIPFPPLDRTDTSPVQPGRLRQLLL